MSILLFTKTGQIEKRIAIESLRCEFCVIPISVSFPYRVELANRQSGILIWISEE